MDTQAPSRSPHALDVGPITLSVVGILTFGGSYLSVGLKPWGPLIVAALFVIWAVAAGLYVANDRRVDPQRANYRSLPQLLRFLINVPPVALYLFARFLSARGSSADTVAGYRDGAILIMLFGVLASGSIDLALRRSTSGQVTQPDRS